MTRRAAFGAALSVALAFIGCSDATNVRRGIFEASKQWERGRDPAADPEPPEQDPTFDEYEAYRRSPSRGP